MEKICSECGTCFECKQDESICWCSSYPKLTQDQLDGGKDCMCKECLKRVNSGNNIAE